LTETNTSLNKANKENTRLPETKIIKGRLDDVLSRHSRQKSEIIPILQDIQNVFGYVPPEAIKETAKFLNVPESAVYGVVTFYAQFHLTRQGRHKVKVCQGTACHVRGARQVMRAIREKLGIAPGETTSDYEFSLERVACLGSCALAPAVVVDAKVYGGMTSAKAHKLIEGLRKQPKKANDCDRTQSGEVS
jgi:NADH:ubiquinone oxidoreductase subunit E